MLNKLRLKFFNRRIIQLHYFNIYHKLFFKKKPKKLFDDGYILLNEKFPLRELDFLNRYLSYDNYDFVADGKKIDLVDLKKIYVILNNIGVISIVKRYLGNRIYCYDNSIKTLGNLKSYNSSWQPHHDSKGRRIKIYIWLNQKNLNTHPLYYLKKTHKKILNWAKYDETRFPQIDLDKFDKIYGEKGSIIIFDTHGIHSHFKDSTIPRSVIELTFESYGIFNRLNNKNINEETSRLNLIELNTLI